MTSADSTSWLMAAANGWIIINGKTVAVSNQRALQDVALHNKSAALKEEVEKKVKELGFDLKELQEDAVKRQLFNCVSLRDWEKNCYKYQGTNVFKKSLF